MNRVTKEKIQGFFVFFIITAIAAILVGGYIYADANGNICDTPWGARDYRCVGYYGRPAARR